MFKKIFKLFEPCEHTYKFYNTKTLYSSIGTGYYEFQYVCTKCGCETSVNQWEIEDAKSKIQSEYNKSLVMGGSPVKSSEFIIPHYNFCDYCYLGPVATLILEKYASQGIDLTQIKPKRKYSHCEGTMTEVKEG